MATIMCMFLIIYRLFCFPVINGDENLPKSSSLETYIVHVSKPQGGDSVDLTRWYQSFMPKSTADNDMAAGERLVHSYRHVASGFAARLSPQEVKEMEKMEGFISATPQKTMSLHTTHTPYFLGLNQNTGVWNPTNFGRGVIIGVLDTGITPGHLSFDDTNMPPPPTRWKGKCEFDTLAACNKKLIGARNFISFAPGPPLDNGGHGSHTSSTVAGNFVYGANIYGQANGTAAGAAPQAHLAMYRVCLDKECNDVDILAGMDAAIDDGVDLISVSLGGPSDDFYSDGIAIGAFAAIQKGIFVSVSAGNNGPGGATCTNEAPWILTVGASTIDRNIVATAVLGNNVTYDGQSLLQPTDFRSDHLLPLVDGYSCSQLRLQDSNATGKVVLCKRGGVPKIQIGEMVKEAGGAAMILMNDEFDTNETMADPHVLPATHVTYDAGVNIQAYIESTTSPTATIAFKGTVIGNNVAPKVAAFSSRGPSRASPGILKPDIIGPGVGILAAWPESVDNGTNKRGTFNMISGTSMSCPHLTGIAALIKSVHLDWSPAAIKSAIMTTATQTNLGNGSIVDETNRRADIFAVGAGHVNPSGAIDPGLIYDLKPDDYIPYLCGLNYTDSEVQIIVHHPVSCASVKSIPEAQLNYPSFAFELGSAVQTFTRTVTNVGEANSSYVSVIEIYGSAPAPVAVTVTPAHLSFGKVKETTTYQLSFSRKSVPTNLKHVEGALIWRSGWRIVRTPFSIKLL